MKAFLIGVALMIVISVLAVFALDSLNIATIEAHQSQNGSVRL